MRNWITKALDSLLNDRPDTERVSAADLVAEATQGESLVQGRPTHEHADSGKHDLETMKACCDAEIAAWKDTGEVPAPYYFERVAILSRKARDYRQEVEYCELYLSVVDECHARHGITGEVGMKAGPRYKAIKSRLPKAHELLQKSQRG